MFRRGHVPIQVVSALIVLGAGLTIGLSQRAPAQSQEDAREAAQDVADVADDAADAAQDAPPADGTTVDVVRVAPPATSDAPDAAPTSPVLRAEEIAEDAQATCGHQRQMLTQSRNDRDIIRTTCIDDKLTQCEANLQNLNNRIAALKEATDASRQAHEMTVIEVLGDKISALRQSANQCIGQDIFETGDTQVRPTIDPYSPDENAVVPPPIQAWPVPYIPPPVSGTS